LRMVKSRYSGSKQMELMSDALSIAKGLIGLDGSST